MGHFACEIFYGNKWHFRDPTLEPDTAVLNKYDTPSIKFIIAHKNVLFSSYRNFSKDSSFILDVFGHYSYGKTDIFPAKNALIFQKTTKFLSNSIWLFFLLGAVVMYNKNNSSIIFMKQKSYEDFLIIISYWKNNSLAFKIHLMKYSSVYLLQNQYF